MVTPEPQPQTPTLREWLESVSLATAEGRMQAQSSPALLAKRTNRLWIPTKYQALVNSYLIEAAISKFKRLMIFVRPQHGKGELVSRYFTAWFLVMQPDKQVILASSEEGFAMEWGRKSRDILEEWSSLLFCAPV